MNTSINIYGECTTAQNSTNSKLFSHILNFYSGGTYSSYDINFVIRLYSLNGSSVNYLNVKEFCISITDKVVIKDITPNVQGSDIVAIKNGNLYSFYVNISYNGYVRCQIMEATHLGSFEFLNGQLFNTDLTNVENKYTSVKANLETFIPTLKNNWTFNERYCNEIIKKNGIVYINCMLSRNEYGNDIECFKLPSNFNKGKRMYFTIPYKANDGTWDTGIVYIGNDGNILITTSKITDRFPVNISFPV